MNNTSNISEIYKDDQNDGFIAVQEEENGTNLQGNPNSEEIFLHQKIKIQEIKVKNEILRSKGNPHPKKIFNGTLYLLTLKDPLFWESSKFEGNIEEYDQVPTIGRVWETDPLLKKIESGQMSSYEMIKTALRTVNEVDYNLFGVECEISLTLVGKSQFWAFTRCFVNKEVNESTLFDTQSMYNNPGDVFNKYTTVFKITKEDRSLRCFVEFGTFCEENGAMIYKTFFKRQLVNFNKNKEADASRIGEDSCDFKIFVVDIGNENLSVKIFLNDSEKPNEICGTFYIPLNKRAKLMFGGIGQSVDVNKMCITTFPKEGNGTIFSNEKKTCNCCSLI